MVNYEELIDLSKEINKQIEKKLKEKLGMSVPPMKPLKLYGKCKYLIMNVNPSINDKDKLLLENSFLTIDKDKYDLGDEEIKKIDGELIFQYFYSKIYQMIKEIDNGVSLFWENKKSFQNLIISLTDKNIGESAKEVLNKIEKNLPEKENDEIVFGELIYFRCKEQREIKKVIEEDENLKEKIKNFLEMQIEYYNPKFVIITNSFVSNFFEENILGEIIEKRHIKDIPTSLIHNNRRFFLSTMFSSGNIDNYSVKRLQNEIKEKLH